MSPNTAAEWLAVAEQRTADAEAIHAQDPNSVGAVYVIGYAIECSLKALLQKRGIPYPTSGQKGHNLKALWKESGYQFSELQDRQGTQTFFLVKWNTDLRYETSLPDRLGFTVNELIIGAKRLTGWIQNKLKRSKPRRH
ncbi:MAG: HEPN domain-containing protein [Hormoscilla sp. GUM202]|nr:HEPN domain-containing protein [Hormoscilla sp. GUM202]